MSTHDFAFGDHENEPAPHPVFGDLGRFDTVEIQEVLLDLEPKVREINRAFTDLFGDRRDGEPWAYLGQDENDEYHVYVTPIQPDDALRLTGRILEILDASRDEVARPHVSNLYDSINTAHRIIGEAARFNAVPSTHVKIVRGR